jgi:hypothetical protein
MTHALEGIWRLVDGRAWDEQGRVSRPYGSHPMGQIAIANGRMLAVLCNGDAESELQGERSYSSYGGTCSFDGSTLDTLVDVASDPTRIGSRQLRAVEMTGPDRMVLRPPQRLYGASMQRRELVWERIWRPGPERKESA